MSRVYLGGTCNGSVWRDELIEKLNVSYFNPVVDDWNEEAQLREEKEKEEATYQLYVITPEMTGVFGIAELVDSSNKTPKQTLLCFIRDYGGCEFDERSWKSLQAVKKLVIKNGALYFDTLQDIADFLNGK